MLEMEEEISLDFTISFLARPHQELSEKCQN